MSRRRIRSIGAALLILAGASTMSCATPDDGDSGGGGGGLQVKYCEEDHRGNLDEGRCTDSPYGGR